MSLCSGTSEQRGEQAEGAARVGLKPFFLPVCCGLRGTWMLKPVVDQGRWLQERDAQIRSMLLKGLNGRAHGGHSHKASLGRAAHAPQPDTSLPLEAVPCWWHV